MKIKKLSLELSIFLSAEFLKFSQMMYAESHASTQVHMLMHEQHYVTMT